MEVGKLIYRKRFLWISTLSGDKSACCVLTWQEPGLATPMALRSRRDNGSSSSMGGVRVGQGGSVLYPGSEGRALG